MRRKKRYACKGGTLSLIDGDKVKLVAIEMEHLNTLMHWRNLPDFRKYFREYREIDAKNQLKWYESTVINDKNTIMFSILDKANGNLIGCCGLCYINWIHRYADLSLYIGYNESYIDEEGYAFYACKTLFDYGFNQLGLNKIWTEIYEFDDKKRKLYEKDFGFHLDGILRENYFYNGKWWNSNIFSLLKNEFNIYP